MLWRYTEEKITQFVSNCYVSRAVSELDMVRLVIKFKSELWSQLKVSYCLKFAKL